jgi:hypothetical protein
MYSFFKINVEAGKTYRIRTFLTTNLESNTEDDLDTIIQVYDSKEKMVTDAAAPSWSNCLEANEIACSDDAYDDGGNLHSAIFLNPTTSGTYYILVKDYESSPTYTDNIYYSINVEDISSKLIPMQLGTSYTETINSENQEYIYTLATDASSDYEIDVTGANLEKNIHIYNTYIESDTIDEMDGAADHTLSISTSDTGVYYISVMAKAGTTTIPNSFTLTANKI